MLVSTQLRNVYMDGTSGGEVEEWVFQVADAQSGLIEGRQDGVYIQTRARALCGAQIFFNAGVLDLRRFDVPQICRL